MWPIGWETPSITRPFNVGNKCTKSTTLVLYFVYDHVLSVTRDAAVIQERVDSIWERVKGVYWLTSSPQIIQYLWVSNTLNLFLFAVHVSVPRVPVRLGHQWSKHDPTTSLPAVSYTQGQRHFWLGFLPQPLRHALPGGSARPWE